MAFLEPCFFLGLGAVALWIHVRWPHLRPQSLNRAILRVGLAFGSFSLAPYALHPVAQAVPEPLSLPAVVGSLVIPTLCYVLVSWVWLIALIHGIGAPPKGGHRVREAAAQRL